MIFRGVGFAVRFLILAILGCVLLSVPAHAALLYKSYVVKKDRGREILCDPYIVQKNDWLLKLFKQRGDISQRDFPEFMRIFKNVNPHIPDINRLHPGEQILIPLRKLTRDALPGQSTGMVTLPFVTISDVPDMLKTYSKEYTVRRGDSVSRLVTRSYGRYGTRSYREGVKLFKILNPKITDLNRIYPGQKLRLPDRELRKQPWYGSLFDPSGKLNIGLVLKDVNRSGKVTPGTSAPQKRKKPPKSPLAEAAEVLDAN